MDSIGPLQSHTKDTPDITGPAYYNARRAQWLTPSQNYQPRANSAFAALQETMNAPDAASNDAVWKSGVEKVHKYIVGGQRFKHPAPMGLVVKILQAGWMRDNTWPKGAVAPDPDDMLPEPAPDASQTPLNA